MSLALSLAMLLAVAAPAQAPADGGIAAVVAPFVGDEVVMVAHIDLTKWDGETSPRRLLGKLAEVGNVNMTAQVASGWLEALKKAGASEVFAVVEPADMPGFPLLVVPLAAGTDGKAIAQVLSGGTPNVPLRWPAVETIRGAIVAGTPTALARIRIAEVRPRAELGPALAATNGAVLQVAILPSTTLRRAIAESMPSLPSALGGGDITTITQGLRWGALGLDLEPKPRLRVIVQAKDADAAQALRKVAVEAIDRIVKGIQSDPAAAGLSKALGRVEPEVRGDRVTLEADLQKTAELLAAEMTGAREAARRAQCSNNLKQIALALHNYHDNQNAFPAAYSVGKDGKPLLSWRVHILPYLDQAPLYKEFHLDEPWDSPHNRALISRMPKSYACPSGSPKLVSEGKTTYLTPRGASTVFPGAQAIRMQEIADGTSNTILAIDAPDDAAVVWTKPDDWEVDPAIKPPGPFGHHFGATNFVFADGSVHFLKDTTSLKLLQALTTRDRGEVVNLDEK